MRRVPTIFWAEGRVVPALRSSCCASRPAAPPGGEADEAGVEAWSWRTSKSPTDRDGQIWLHYGLSDPGRYVSAADVIGGKVPRERIEGKIVLSAPSAVGLFDLRSTPVERVMPGVEIHAQAIEGILDILADASELCVLGAEICFSVATGLGMRHMLCPCLGAVGARARWGRGRASLGLSWYPFVSHGVLLDVAYPLVSSFAVFLLLTFTNYFREEKRRAQIRGAFGQYLSPELVEQLTREPDRLCSAERRESTVSALQRRARLHHHRRRVQDQSVQG